MKNKKFQYVIYRVKLRFRDTKKSGFLLIEIMVSLMAFAGLAILMARYQVAVLSQNKEVFNYLKAVDIASDSIEQSDGVEKMSNQFQVERSVTDFIVPLQLKSSGLSLDRLKKLKTIEVKVSWNTLDGCKRLVHIKSTLPAAKEIA